MSKAAPKISVITPSFNQDKYLEQTIKSVVSQEYPNLEYLIFDGGSTDNSVSIIKKYAKKYPYIKWRSRKDKGQVNALNDGLKQASGEIISYLNSDDFYLSGTLQKVATFFRKNPDKTWVVGDCKVTKKSLNWTFFLKRIMPFHLSKLAIKIYNPINQPAVFLTRKLIKKVGIFDSSLHFAFDYDYWLRCSKFSLPGRIKRQLAVFRIHNNSKGNTGYKKQFEEDLEVIKKHSSNRLIILTHFMSKYLIFAFYKFLK